MADYTVIITGLQEHERDPDLITQIMAEGTLDDEGLNQNGRPAGCVVEGDTARLTMTDAHPDIAAALDGHVYHGLHH